MHRKIAPLIFFKSKHESVSKVFGCIKILTAHDFYVYELIKFVWKSVENFSTTALLENFIELSSCLKCSRKSRLLTSTISPKRSTFHSFSLKHRGGNFLNLSSQKGFLPKFFGVIKNVEVTDFIHTFRDLYKPSKIDLAKFVFDR